MQTKNQIGTPLKQAAPPGQDPTAYANVTAGSSAKQRRSPAVAARVEGGENGRRRQQVTDHIGRPRVGSNVKDHLPEPEIMVENRLVEWSRNRSIKNDTETKKSNGWDWWSRKSQPKQGRGDPSKESDNKGNQSRKTEAALSQGLPAHSKWATYWSHLSRVWAAGSAPASVRAVTVGTDPLCAAM